MKRWEVKKYLIKEKIDFYLSAEARDLLAKLRINQNLSMQITTIQKLKNLIDRNYKFLIGSIVVLLLIILIISL